MLKISVLTNDKDFLDGLTKYLCQLDDVKSVNHYPDLIDLMIATDKPERPDLVFIDIEYKLIYIPHLFELLSKSFRIVFLGLASSELQECCSFYRIPFLTKPVDLDILNSYIHNLIPINLSEYGEQPGISKSDHFFVKCDKGKIKRVKIANILYVEAKQNYVSIHQDTFNSTFNFTLNGIMQILPKPLFVRVHRSYVINIDRTQAIESNSVFLDNDEVIPIGHSYKKEIFNNFMSKTLDIANLIRIYIVLEALNFL
ncbi:two-component system LytT family response regulator [Pedobacter sp. UYP24]